MAWLFAIGATLFALGSSPPYFNSVNAKATAVTFFAGSLLFTTAAYLQYRMSINDGATGPRTVRFAGLTQDIVASGIQLVGTVFFNISTLAAIDQTLSVESADRLVWAPDALGSTAFLVSSVVALNVARRETAFSMPSRGTNWWIAVVNLLGSVAFGISALWAIVLPATGEMANVAVVNAATFVGAIGFLIGALLTVRHVSGFDARTVDSC